MRMFLKRSMALICSLAILLSIFSSKAVQAKVDNENNAIPFIETEMVQELSHKYSSTPEYMDFDTVFLPLSGEENIKYISDVQKISYDEAEQLYINEISNDDLLQKNDQVMPTAITYKDEIGIVLKRFNVNTGIVHLCTIAATINVKLRTYSDSPTNRKFIEVYDSGVSLYSSSLFNWSTSTCSAVIQSNGTLKLNVSGNATATVDKSLTIDLAAAGFSIIDMGVSTTRYVTKFVIFDWVFDPTYPGAILN